LLVADEETGEGAELSLYRSVFDSLFLLYSLYYIISYSDVIRERERERENWKAPRTRDVGLPFFALLRLRIVEGIL